MLQKTLGTFAVDYVINAYCDNPRAMFPLYSALHRNILDVFNEHDVQIMTPAYEGDPERPKVVPREQWYAAPAVSGDGGPESRFSSHELRVTSHEQEPSPATRDPRLATRDS